MSGSRGSEGVERSCGGSHEALAECRGGLAESREAGSANHTNRCTKTYFVTAFVSLRFVSFRSVQKVAARSRSGPSSPIGC